MLSAWAILVGLVGAGAGGKKIPCQDFGNTFALSDGPAPISPSFNPFVSSHLRFRFA